MRSVQGKVVALAVGQAGCMHKKAVQDMQIELDGIVGDRHRGFSRTTWEGDKEPEGTQRRNERQWSAMSTEEIQLISRNLALATNLDAATLAANLCLEGIPGFSQLPRGTTLKFSSGAKLIVEEYNPPCTDMGETLTALPDKNSFPRAAIGLRGLVGVVEVPGAIAVGDEVTVELWDEADQANQPRT